MLGAFHTSALKSAWQSYILRYPAKFWITVELEQILATSVSISFDLSRKNASLFP